jgi:hypothetical protein
MKKLIVLLLVVAVTLTAVPAFAAQRGSMEGITEDSVIDRAGDWITTRGKSPEEAKALIAERKARRVERKAKKRAEKAKKRAEKEAAKTKKEMQKQQKQMKSKWGK